MDPSKNNYIKVREYYTSRPFISCEFPKYSRNNPVKMHSFFADGIVGAQTRGQTSDDNFNLPLHIK